MQWITLIAWANKENSSTNLGHFCILHCFLQLPEIAQTNLATWHQDARSRTIANQQTTKKWTSLLLLSNRKRASCFVSTESSLLGLRSNIERNNEFQTLSIKTIRDDLIETLQLFTHGWRDEKVVPKLSILVTCQLCEPKILLTSSTFIWVWAKTSSPVCICMEKQTLPFRQKPSNCGEQRMQLHRSFACSQAHENLLVQCFLSDDMSIIDNSFHKSECYFHYIGKQQTVFPSFITSSRFPYCCSIMERKITSPFLFESEPSNQLQNRSDWLYNLSHLCVIVDVLIWILIEKRTM